MTESLQAGLIITAIGMGLVFGAILLLWGLMALIVQIGARFEENPAPPVEVQAGNKTGNSDKRLAAVAALAVALAIRERSSFLKKGLSISPNSSWLQIKRAQAVQEKSLLFTSRQNRRS